MKSFFSFLFLLVIFQLPAEINIPTTFYIDQPLVYIENSFSKIWSEEKTIGCIKWMNKKFHLYNDQEELEAIAAFDGLNDFGRMIFHVIDKEGFVLGRIEEDFGFLTTFYSFYSSNDELLVQGKESLLQRLIIGPDEQIYATKEKFPFTSTSVVEIKDVDGSLKIDARLFLFMINFL